MCCVSVNLHMHLWEYRASLLCYWKQSFCAGIHFHSASRNYTVNNTISFFLSFFHFFFCIQYQVVLAAWMVIAGFVTKTLYTVTTPFNNLEAPKPDIHLNGMCLCVVKTHSRTQNPVWERRELMGYSHRMRFSIPKCYFSIAFHPH